MVFSSNVKLKVHNMLTATKGQTQETSLNQTFTLNRYRVSLSLNVLSFSCARSGADIGDHLLPIVSFFYSPEEVGCSSRRCTFQTLELCEPFSSLIPFAVNSFLQNRPLGTVFLANMSEEGHLPFPYVFRQFSFRT